MATGASAWAAPAVESEPRAAAVEARAHAGVIARRLRFVAPFSETEPDYTLRDAPALGLSAVVRPLSPLSEGGASFGFVATAAAARAVTPGDGGRRLETRMLRWDLGAELRSGGPLEVAIDVRHGGDVFQVERDASYGSWVANVDYRFVRAAVGVAHRWPAAFVQATAGHRFVTSVGELGDGDHIAGMWAVGRDLTAGVGIGVSEPLVLHASVEYVRYTLGWGSLDVGTDEYLSFWVGLGVALEELP